MLATSYPSPITYAPPRIPKLKYRNHVDDSVVTAGQSSFTSVRPSLSERPSAPVTPPQSPPRNQSPPSSDVWTKPPKKKGMFGFLTLKEPSTSAWQEFAELQRKEAASNGSKVAGLPAGSDRALPEYVPKVNSKWDGMPAHHQRQTESKDSGKASLDLSSPFSRSSNKSGQYSKGSISTSHSSDASLRRSNSVDGRHSAANSNKASNRSSSNTPHTQAINMFKEPSQALDYTSTPPVNEPASSSSVLDSSVVFEKHTPSEALETDVSRDLNHYEPSSEAQPDTSTVTPAAASGMGAESTTLLQPTIEANPTASLPPRAVQSGELTQSSKPTTQPLPKGVVKRSIPQIETDGQSWPLPQWPLPTSPADAFIDLKDSKVLSPPIPAKSKRRLSRQNSSGDGGDANASEGDVSPVSAKSPVMWISDESREWRPPPGFRSGPISPPQSPDSAKPPKAIGGPSRSPSQSTLGTNNLLSPAFQPGRTLTKDSDLATIPESDTSSVLHAQPASQEESQSSGDVDANNESPPGSRASSEMSAQWYQSPRERLSLGCSITHTEENFPWPLSDETAENYTIDANDGSSTPTPDRGSKSRVSLIGMFKK